ncbi:MAG: hypothetical protein WA693_22965, partial [Pseudolabrys sp.]
HARATPDVDRMDCGCCHASRVSRNTNDYCTRGGLSYRTVFFRPGGQPVVLSNGSSDTAQVLVLAREEPVDATTGRAG